MTKIIKFKPSYRLVENCRYCMYSHYGYKNRWSMQTNYFCLRLATVASIDELKKLKIPVYQGDKDGKYVDHLVDNSYAYIENPDNILSECPLEEYNETGIS